MAELPTDSFMQTQAKLTRQLASYAREHNRRGKANARMESAREAKKTKTKKNVETLGRWRSQRKRKVLKGSASLGKKNRTR